MDIELAIKDLAEETGISQDEFLFVLGIFPECTITTVDEAEAFYNNVEPGSKKQDAAMIKWIELCSTNEEIEKAYADVQTSNDTELERLVAMKWLDLCTTVEAARYAFHAAICDSEFERMAAEKWSELCTTTQEVSEIYDAAGHEPRLEWIALEKWEKLLLPDLEAASTIQKIIQVVDDAPPAECSVRQLAFKKMVQIQLGQKD